MGTLLIAYPIITTSARHDINLITPEIPNAVIERKKEAWLKASAASR
jgi:hypothetical protein